MNGEWREGTVLTEGLHFTYSGSQTPALVDVSITIDEGEFVLLAGPSGSGKSTLARCLNGLVPHFHGGRFGGKVVVCGLDTRRATVAELARHVGFVFQDPENQLVSMEVEREIAFGLENIGLPKDVIGKRIEEALDTVGILHLRKKHPKELSGGEKQRVAIASVLALHPNVLVLDEPTSELDPQGAEDVLKVVERINDELGITVILIEHRLDRVMHLVDRVIVMDRGRIIADGEPREVMKDERLRETGTEIPPVVDLTLKVMEHYEPDILRDGFKIPLTVKEGRKILRPLFRRVNGVEWKPQTHHQTGKTVVLIENVWFGYDQPILKGVSLNVRKGEFVALLGRNASGKTTLLKHLIGLNIPNKGKVVVCGLDTRRATVAELARHVGFVFQNPNDHLIADTVFEEVAFPLKSMGYDNIEERVNEVLKLLKLERYRDCYPRSLSGGEKQRVAIASVLAFEPEILILDEPTRGLDFSLKEYIMKILDEYRKNGRTVIYSTHDVETAARHGDRAVIMSEGKIVIDDEKHKGLANALLFSPQINRMIQSFRRYGVPDEILTVEEALEVIDMGLRRGER
jgi:energy-coupling factor transport system ATP-binding protein